MSQTRHKVFDDCTNVAGRLFSHIFYIVNCGGEGGAASLHFAFVSKIVELTLSIPIQNAK
jgi:hypothetical protein